MRQVGVTGSGGPEVLRIEEVSPPEPRSGEVLIRVAAAGVNRPDIAQRKGLYPPPPDASPILGLEVAGVVTAVGDGVTALHPGDRVCALVNGGGYAEFVRAPAGQCLPWPAGYDAVRAAALPENYFTVWTNLFDIGRLSAGKTVLIHGGSSGIGTTAIQLARAFGARVLNTAGTAEKCSACLALGAEVAINYRLENFVEVVQRVTERQGVDLMLDMVGGPYLARNVSVLARGGTLVVIAVQGGSKDPDFDLIPVMVKRLHITGSTLRPRSAADKAAIAASLLDHAWPLLEAGRIGPVIHAVFPMDRVADAHRLMEEGSHIGKIMLTMDDR